MRKLFILLAIAGIGWFGFRHFSGGGASDAGRDPSEVSSAARQPAAGSSVEDYPEEEPGGGRPLDPGSPFHEGAASLGPEPSQSEAESDGAISSGDSSASRTTNHPSETSDRRGAAGHSAAPLDLEGELAAARALVASGDSLAAVRRLSAAYSSHGHGRHRQALRAAIDPLVADLYFSRRNVPEICDFVEVRSGDTLGGIAKRFRSEKDIPVSPGMIMKTNGIADARRIRAGQSLKVLSEPMRIEVSKSTHVLDVYLGDTALLTYRVGLGKNDSTPVGTFEIVTKQIEPIWYNAGKRVPFGDARNVLGTRWLGFENTREYSGYGIHGTWEPDSIGKNASEGCVRMRNPEVEALFELVPRGVFVTIRR